MQRALRGALACDQLLPNSGSRPPGSPAYFFFKMVPSTGGIS